VFVYEDNLNVYELMEWSNIMDKYFHYGDVYEEKKWSMWLHGWKSAQLCGGMKCKHAWKRKARPRL